MPRISELGANGAAAIVPRPVSARIKGDYHAPLTSPIDGQKAVDAFLKHQSPADILEGAKMIECDLHVSLAGRDITSMQFLKITAIKGDFSNNTQGKGAFFADSNLADAVFSNSDFRGATFSGHETNLDRAHFDGAKLDAGKFDDVELVGADFAGASMEGVLFAPHSLPDPSYLASAQGLESMRSPLNVIALRQVVKQFSDLGVNSRARDVEFAVQRSEQDLYWYRCETGTDYAGVPFANHALFQRLVACTVAVGRSVGLDATCEFGRRPWRPLWIIMGLTVIWTGFLSFIILRPNWSGVSVVFKGARGQECSLPLERLIRQIAARRKYAVPTIRMAFALSISSVFNLPFKDFEIGRWIRLLGRQEYEFRMRGRVRSLMGCLTLLCFYLLALSILSFLSTAPFSQ